MNDLERASQLLIALSELLASGTVLSGGRQVFARALVDELLMILGQEAAAQVERALNPAPDGSGSKH